MKTHDFHAELWLPHPVTEIFGFFAAASNLQTLTLEWVSFGILTPKPMLLRPGG